MKLGSLGEELHSFGLFCVVIGEGERVRRFLLLSEARCTQQDYYPLSYSLLNTAYYCNVPRLR